MAFSFDLGLAISAERYGAISAGPEQYSSYISFTNSRFIGSYYDSLVLMIQHILTKHNIRVVTMKRRLPNFCIIESYDFDSMVPEHPARPDNCFPIGTLRPK